MKKNFAIIGLGRFGGSICRTLIEAGQEVLVMDKSEERVNEYMNIATHAVMANAQDEATLKSLGIRNFDHVIVAIGEDIQASILVTLMAKELGVPFITAKAQNEYHARVLEKIGADKVVHPERDMGKRIAHHLVSKNILDYLELSDEFSLAEIRVTNKKFCQKSLLTLNFRQKFNVTVVAIRRGKNELIVSPSASEIVLIEDCLLVVGSTDCVRNLDDKLGST
ncbi:potassium channel family protein [Vagococcus entomophilus]|uniref:Potassium transporter Trk n=1 Tax=Vagococcus entomophilus TaxID=1160095 RepID=A0A430AEP5_9ENTE|nr:TrkA family potassium uptake protein [Vagococcus entomophilus]RSU05898.1 potassium transporter Trk [Vagococcus entomophilus]